MISNNPNDSLLSQPVQKLVAQYAASLKIIEDHVQRLPSMLGLTTIEQVTEMLESYNETGSVRDYFQKLSAENPILTPGVRRQGQRGLAIPTERREKIIAALLRGDQGLDIAQRFGVSASTVSNFRKELVKEGKLKTK